MESTPPEGIDDLLSHLNELRETLAEKDGKIQVMAVNMGIGIRHDGDESEELPYLTTTFAINGQSFELPAHVAKQVGIGLIAGANLVDTLTTLMRLLSDTFSLETPAILRFVETFLQAQGARSVEEVGSLEDINTARAEYEEALNALAAEKDPAKADIMMREIVGKSRFSEIMDAGKTNWGG